MGIHGLTTYLRQHRSTLSHIVSTSSGDQQHDAIRIVVDGWS